MTAAASSFSITTVITREPAGLATACAAGSATGFPACTWPHPAARAASSHRPRGVRTPPTSAGRLSAAAVAARREATPGPWPRPGGRARSRSSVRSRGDRGARHHGRMTSARCRWVLVLLAVALGAGCGGGHAGAAAPRTPSPAPRRPATGPPRPRLALWQPAIGGAAARRAAIPILMYHVVSAAPPGAPYPELWVAQRTFAREMRALRRRGYQAITLATAVRAWRRGGPLPRRPVVLTFDDGYRSDYTHAAPVLRRLGWA